MISIKKFAFNPLQENTFVLHDETGECVIIDAGCYFTEEKEALSAYMDKQKLRPVKLLNTHCHFDHILGVPFCRNKYKIPFFIHRADEFMIQRATIQGDIFGIPLDPVDSPDGFIDEGDSVNFGNSTLEAIHVPGHAPGSLVFYHSQQQFIIAGDVLFRGSIGRTDLPGGNYDELIENIKTKLLSLSDNVVVYCGHGPETTIGHEKSSNPFLAG